jgi:hypothetical protein
VVELETTELVVELADFYAVGVQVFSVAVTVVIDLIDHHKRVTVD